MWSSNIHLRAISGEISQLEIYFSKISFKSPRGQWVKTQLSSSYWSTHYRHSVAPPYGWNMGFLVLLQSWVYILHLSGWWLPQFYVDGLVQDCCISSALGMEILQSSTKPSMHIILDITGLNLVFFKSPQYTGGDFMFLYRFVRRRHRRRRRRRPQILVHAITFEQLLGFLSFLAQLLALTCRLPDYIFVDFRRDLDLDFSRSNMEFAISQPKMVRLPRNKKQT